MKTRLFGTLAFVVIGWVALPLRAEILGTKLK